MDAVAQEFKNLSTFEWGALFAPVLIIAYVFYSSTVTNSRTTAIPPETERILVVGASSGIGRAVALQYAKRGAKVAIMGRRNAQLEAVKKECDVARGISEAKTLAVVGDFTDVDAILKAKSSVEKGMINSARSDREAR